MAKKQLEDALAREIGKPIEEIRNTPLETMRSEVERTLGHPLNYKSWYTSIGRGNVLGDRVVSHQQVEERLAGIMHGKKKA